MWKSITSRRLVNCSVEEFTTKEVKKALETKSFVAYIEYDPETRLYVGIIPGISGAHTQGAKLDELHENLKEVLNYVSRNIKDN